MKKLIAMICALTLLLSLAACGKKNEQPQEPEQNDPVVETPVEEAPVEEAPVEEAPAEENEETPF